MTIKPGVMKYTLAQPISTLTNFIYCMVAVHALLKPFGQSMDESGMYLTFSALFAIGMSQLLPYSVSWGPDSGHMVGSNPFAFL